MVAALHRAEIVVSLNRNVVNYWHHKKKRSAEIHWEGAFG